MLSSLGGGGVFCDIRRQKYAKENSMLFELETRHIVMFNRPLESLYISTPP